MIKHYWRVIRKDTTLLILMAVFVILAIMAVVIADKLNFISDTSTDDNPSLVNQNI